MRHDAGLSIRQILCLSACLQITSLERLTKTEKEFCFLPFWSPQSPCSQPRSASGHCCLFFWHYLSLMAVAGCRNKFLFYQRAAEVCRCLNHFTVYPSALATPDKYVRIVTPHQCFFVLWNIGVHSWTAALVLGGLKPGDQTVFRIFFFQKKVRCCLYLFCPDWRCWRKQNTVRITSVSQKRVKESTLIECIIPLLRLSINQKFILEEAEKKALTVMLDCSTSALK